MIDWAKLRKKYKKMQVLIELEAEMEQIKMEKIRSNENFRIVDERRAAKILGISYTKIKYLRKQGKISFLRIGRSIRYKLSQLESFVQRGIVEAES